MLLATSAATASPSREWAGLPEAKVNQMADAIYKAEGGKKARKPYGVLSIKVSNEAEARKVCINSIRNNYKRWQKAGCPGGFVDFMADRWCPASADPAGNRNWKKNVARLINIKLSGAEHPLQ